MFYGTIRSMEIIQNVYVVVEKNIHNKAPGQEES